jgi:hypothetical protein
VSTYSVSDSPSQIVLGGNSTEVALINQGPSTIFLGNDTSVSPLNGFPLAPMGQGIWNAAQPLFGVCNSGKSATLSTHPESGKIDANRSKFNVLLGTQSMNQLTQAYTGIIEVGHCETIELEIIEVNNGPGPAPDMHTILVAWYDSSGIATYTAAYYPPQIATISVGGTQPTCFLKLQIPVVGAFVSFGIYPTDTAALPNGTHMQQWTVRGTNRVLPYRAYSGAYFNPPSVGSAGNQVYYQTMMVNSALSGLFNASQTAEDWFSFNTSNYNDVFFSTMGKLMSIGISSQGITGAGTVAISPLSGAPTNVPGTGIRYHQWAIPTGAQRLFVDGIQIPISQALKFAFLDGIAGGSVSIHVAWKDA